MTFAAVAIGGAALIGGGMATSAYFGNKAAGSAKRAAAAAAAEMRRNKAEAIGYQKPYYTAGNRGLNSLSGLLTGYDSSGNVIGQDERNALFQKSPGYQFRLESAQNALQASQAARGGMLSGGAMKEMNKYTQGIASDEYGNYINQLSGLAGMGQQAATNMGNYAINAGSQIANYVQQTGMAGANGSAQMGNIIGGGMQQIGGSMFGAGMGGMSPAPKSPSGFSSAGGGQYNSGMMNSVYSGSNMPNTNLQMSGTF